MNEYIRQIEQQNVSNNPIQNDKVVSRYDSKTAK